MGLITLTSNTKQKEPEASFCFTPVIVINIHPTMQVVVHPLPVRHDSGPPPGPRTESVGGGTAAPRTFDGGSGGWGTKREDSTSRRGNNTIR